MVRLRHPAWMLGALLVLAMGCWSAPKAFPCAIDRTCPQDLDGDSFLCVAGTCRMTCSYSYVHGCDETEVCVADGLPSHSAGAWDGVCTPPCSEEQPCPDGLVCDGAGACQVDTSLGAGGKPDGGDGGTTSTGGKSNTGGGGASGGGGEPAIDCEKCLETSSCTADCARTFTGQWKRDSDGSVITFQQEGGGLTGSLPSPAFAHTIKCEVALPEARCEIYRTNRTSNCLTVMLENLRLSDNGESFRSEVTGTDGKCDLSTSYTETSQWNRIAF